MNNGCKCYKPIKCKTFDGIEYCDKCLGILCDHQVVWDDNNIPYCSKCNQELEYEEPNADLEYERNYELEHGL